MLKEILLTAPSPEGAISICVEVIYSDRRTLGLEVTAEGRVRARVPRRAGDRAVKEFVEKKKDWILEKYLLQKKRREERREAAGTGITREIRPWRPGTASWPAESSASGSPILRPKWG